MTERTDQEVEKTFSDALRDLANDRLGRGGTRQVKDAAEQSLQRQDKSKALNDAIRPKT